MQDFKNLYAVSKTLCFELKPVGKTLNFIQEKKLIDKDEQRAKDYPIAKKIIDRYHQQFIEKALQSVPLNVEDLYLIENLFFKKNKEKKEEEQLKNLQKIARKTIVQAFKNQEDFTILTKKEIFEKLKHQVKDENEWQIVEDFSKFTTYFSGFHTNRKNMYEEEGSTAIAHRLIAENLPRFLNNKKNWIEKIIINTTLLNELKVKLEPHLEGLSMEDFFELENYAHFLTQKQIDLYNLMMGGKSLENGEKIKGINEYINLYNQQQKEGKNKIPQLKELYKQILSDRDSASFVLQAFENVEQVQKAVQDFYTQMQDFGEKKINIFKEIEKILKNILHLDTQKIYISGKNLTQISQKVFGEYGKISSLLQDFYQEKIYPNFEKEYRKGNEKKQEELDKKQKKFLEQNHSIAFLEQVISQENTENKNKILHFLQAFESNEKENFADSIQKKYENFCENPEKAAIKILLDETLQCLHFLKIFSSQENEKELDFYNDFEIYVDFLEKNLIPLYNQIRNFVTKKPYSTEKIKLNFNNSTLLAGWDKNKEKDNFGILLRKNEKYFLAILEEKNKKVFEDFAEGEENFEKIDYKLLPGANKMLPKVFFAKNNIDYYAPSKELLNNYEKEKHKKGENFSLDFCHELIDFFKTSIAQHEDWSQFEFQFSETSSYQDMSNFYREVEQQGYKINFSKISSAYIEQLVDQGKLYLFEIYNKDFSEHSKGKPNLHTLYFKALFAAENLQNVIYKLNGEAEIFWRKASLDPAKVAKHPKNQPIKNKNEKNPKKESLFGYDLLKDKRFTEDKFLFHVPITLNFKAEGKEKFNEKVKNYLKENEVKIIGIDRGERHLLYVSLLDENGKLLLQKSFNQLGEVDYQKLLDKKEKERKSQRENWQAIDTIKELKSGFLSLVVHEIAQMMLEHKAIVVLEDLNFGFKRGRFKVEKQVYQKFEKALIEKLNYLVFKDKKNGELGSIYQALQLTEKFESFQKMGKQNGFLFYVPAWNTSKIDPVTGFVNYFYTPYQSVEKSLAFFNKFNNISYNSEKHYFEFEVKNYAAFNPKAANIRQDWTICTFGERLENFRNPAQNNSWDTRTVHLTSVFKQLFSEFKMDIFGDLQAQILAQTSKTFFEKLHHLFKLTLQMRNSQTGGELDYLISPVGDFFDSRTTSDDLPKDADANGAFNIARKGLLLLEKIRTEAKDVRVSNEEWLRMAQGVEIINK